MMEAGRRSDRRDRLRVGVLVDLERSQAAGGHVKCWERLAAAAGVSDGIDLTVHFSGDREETAEVSPWLRIVTHRPVLSTRGLRFLSHVPDHADLARRHPGLARWLQRYDVVHTTDAFFAFTRTAERAARRLGLPLVNSIHTDTPAYAGIFTAETVERILGRNRASRFLLDDLRIAERVRRRLLRRLADHQGRCAFALVSRPDDLERACAVLPAERVGLLRRGVDRTLFAPGRRERDWLRRRFGVPPERFLVLCVGRVDAGKNVLVLARAVRSLLDGGAAVHLMCAGNGAERDAIAGLLGPAAACPGFIDPDELARVYASADLLCQPSEVEVLGNVVLEALAAGLPVAVAERSGMARVLEPGAGLVVGGAADDWADAIAGLMREPARLAAMARAAREHAARALPSWHDVLAQDLVPVWRAAAAISAPARRTAA